MKINRIFIIATLKTLKSLQMKTMTKSIIAIAITFGLIACGTQTKKEADNTQKTEEVSAQPEKPTVAELHAYKAMHHAIYMKTTAAAAGGTNKLLHTKKLPTEGTDPVVTPALDHLYSKAVIDLTSGPVFVEFPEVLDGRYYSIHITDQEHYTIYDEIRPIGKYVFVRKGKNMKVPAGAKVIESPGDYPHLFIRVQVKTAEDLPNTLAVQERIKLTGESKPLDFDNSIEFTIGSFISGLSLSKSICILVGVGLKY